MHLLCLRVFSALCFRCAAPVHWEVTFLFLSMVASSKNLNRNCEIMLDNANMHEVKRLPFSHQKATQKRRKRKVRRAESQIQGPCLLDVSASGFQSEVLRPSSEFPLLILQLYQEALLYFMDKKPITFQKKNNNLIHMWTGISPANPI